MRLICARRSLIAPRRARGGSRRQVREPRAAWARKNPPALALRQGDEQIGQSDVGPEPRQQAVTAARSQRGHSMRTTCGGLAYVCERGRLPRLLGVSKMPDAVTPDYLLKGAVYSLEQCGVLLCDADLLYRSGAYASCVVLAAFAREALGQWKILLDLREEVIGGKTATIPEIKDRCSDHVQKQKAGMLRNVEFHDARRPWFGVRKTVDV